MIQYFTNIFGKSIDAISEADLLSYFKDPRQESNSIEFKSYNQRDPAKEAEKIGKIIRSVAAMLNSGGGIIIWGAPQPTKDPATGEHIVQGNLSPVDFSIGKDRFISTVFSNISPSPAGIHFESVQLAGGGYVYLIEVQASDYPPHQFDGRYYARFDSLSKPAPHHYVEALMKQVKQPVVQGYVDSGESFGGYKEYVAMPAMLNIYNLSRHIPAMNFYYEITVNGRTILLTEDVNSITEKKKSLKAPESRTLISNRPLHRRFVIYAPVTMGRPFRQESHIDLVFWGDNVPLHFTRYKITHEMDYSEGRNTLSMSLIYENKPAYEIIDEDGRGEQTVMRTLREEGITAYNNTFSGTEIGKRLME